jgi:glutathione S-transferase
MSEPLRVFTFGPLYGLPTSGPFGLKLELALRMAGVPYERVYEDDNRKGPKRKSPWIEQGSVRMGDTSLILAHLGIDLDAHLSPADRARGLVLRRMLEEHWHQVLEYELFVHPAGLHGLDEAIARAVPGFLVPALRWYVRRNFRLHLFERGIGRHAPEDVARMGREDLDALAAWLDGREWAVGDAPSVTDCTTFGLLAPALWSPSPTPCFTYAKQLPPLTAYVERIRSRWFSAEIPALPTRALAAV